MCRIRIPSSTVYVFYLPAVNYSPQNCRTEFVANSRRISHTHTHTQSRGLCHARRAVGVCVPGCMCVFVYINPSRRGTMSQSHGPQRAAFSGLYQGLWAIPSTGPPKRPPTTSGDLQPIFSSLTVTDNGFKSVCQLKWVYSITHPHSDVHRTHPSSSSHTSGERSSASLC
jgi:hypothetical protein